MKKSLISTLLFSVIFGHFVNVYAEPTRIFNVKGYTLTGPAGNEAQLLSFTSMVFDEGKVLFVGDEHTAKSKFPTAKAIDGLGQTLLPGLTDAHGHIIALGMGLSQVDLRGINSEAAAVNAVADFARQNPQKRWITGRGWNQVLWLNKQFPTRQSLDKLGINKPIVLSRIDGHATWVNSKALQIAGIDKNTPDPDGGKIIRDKNGEATGVLIDTAEALVTKHIPAPSELDVNYALDVAIDHLLALGITSVHDAGIDQMTYQLYQQRQKQDRLPMRIYAMLSGSSDNLLQWLKAGPIISDDDKLSIRSVKFYTDGALGSRGAALIEPYSDEKDHKGLLVTQPDVLLDRVFQTLKHGFQANIHAIGDRGNRIVLNSIEKAYAQKIGLNGRHRIEHAQVIAVDDIPKLKSLNLIASMQPTHATSDMNMAEDRVGSQRIKGAYAWRTLLDQGTIIASGSDFPVELANPFHGIHAAVTRQNHQNQPKGGWKPEEKMTLTEALRTFTLDAAYAAHQEKTLGSLEPGKWADFILVDQDITKSNPQDLWKVQVFETWVAGQQVFKKAL